MHIRHLIHVFLLPYNFDFIYHEQLTNPRQGLTEQRVLHPAYGSSSLGNLKVGLSVVLKQPWGAKKTLQKTLPGLIT
jgi:hypothetical protein